MISRVLLSKTKTSHTARVEKIKELLNGEGRLVRNGMEWNGTETECRKVEEGVRRVVKSGEQAERELSSDSCSLLR